MMERIDAQTRQRVARKLGKAVFALAVVVAAQIVALEVVLRGWQAEEAMAVFVGIGSSALLFALSLILFLRTRRKAISGEGLS